MSNLLVQNIKHTNNTTAMTVDTSGNVTTTGNTAVGGTLAVTGVHTVGNNAVHTSDGGAVTQNLVQGLAKCWIQFNGTGSIGTADSFNRGGLTDNGTGDYTVTYINNMANDDYAVSGGGNASQFTFDGVPTTSTVTVETSNSSGTQADITCVTVTTHGDLA
jgi:hypothetical protein